MTEAFRALRYEHRDAGKPLPGVPVTVVDFVPVGLGGWVVAVIVAASGAVSACPLDELECIEPAFLGLRPHEHEWTTKIELEGNRAHNVKVCTAPGCGARLDPREAIAR
ncbi:MAG TPA: hypothetical protein VGQ58_04545 [Candidatus Limnocylindrales bacterium]|jgi:hypothetical protein|nr:hypothetical protein [Candidatus Limnocylindrales bacterium]